MAKPWFRWYRDTTMDVKFRFVHERAAQLVEPEPSLGVVVGCGENDVSLTDVIAVWALMLESVTDDNGTVTEGFGDSFSDFIARTYDMPFEFADAILKALEEYRLITHNNGIYQIKNWQRRQYLDDTNAERQARYRERKKQAVTARNGSRNGKVTPTDTDTESESEKKRYRFSGRTIRLDDSLYESWHRNYPDLDLDAQLQSLDDWISEQSDAVKANWVFAVSGALKNRQEAVRAKKKPKIVGPQFKPEKAFTPEPPEVREARVSAWKNRGKHALVRGDDEGQEGTISELAPQEAGISDLLPALQAMDYAQED